MYQMGSGNAPCGVYNRSSDTRIFPKVPRGNTGAEVLFLGCFGSPDDLCNMLVVRNADAVLVTGPVKLMSGGEIMLCN